VSVLEEAQIKARTLVEALPYIRSYRGEVAVVKIGGAALSEPRLAQILAEDLVLLSYVGVRVIVVHGGGAQISKAMSSSGAEARFVGGMRVTDDAAMEQVQRVLMGSVNTELVGRLNSAGATAVGLSGVDGAVMTAQRMTADDGSDLGRVGRVTDVNGPFLESLLDLGYLPVLASIATSSEHTTLNVNADVVAAAVAAATKARKLIYVTDVAGIYRDFHVKDSLVSEIKADELEALVSSLDGGMRPKALSAIEAVRAGVSKVHMIDGRVEHALLLEIFTDAGVGTEVLS
jgi:acetylglutamate kinase